MVKYKHKHSANRKTTPARLVLGQESQTASGTHIVLLADGQEHPELAGGQNRDVLAADEAVEVPLDTRDIIGDEPNVNMVPEPPRNDLEEQPDGRAAEAEQEALKETNLAPEQSKTWANLFRDNRSTKDAIKLDQYERTGKAVPIEFDDVEELETIMGPCLVGCFMGRHPGRQGVQAISRRWGVPNSFHLHLSGWVVFKFEKEADKERILLGGPYFVFGIPLFVKQMPRCFLFGEDGRHVPAWVQVHGLPPDCWSQRVLSMVGSEIGRPLYTDKLTRTRERISFACLLVEVDIAESRVYEVPVDLPTGASITLTV